MKQDILLKISVPQTCDEFMISDMIAHVPWITGSLEAAEPSHVNKTHISGDSYFIGIG